MPKRAICKRNCIFTMGQILFISISHDFMDISKVEAREFTLLLCIKNVYNTLTPLASFNSSTQRFISKEKENHYDRTLFFPILLQQGENAVYGNCSFSIVGKMYRNIAIRFQRVAHRFKEPLCSCDNKALLAKEFYGVIHNFLYYLDD